MNESTINSSIGQIIEPEPIGYSFNTPGWYLVLGILLLVVLIFVLIQYRKYKKNAYRREALARIETLLQTDQRALAFEINKLLKIIAIQLFGREKVASLFGLPWFNFLNSTLKTPIDSSFDEFSKAIYNSDHVLDDKQTTKLLEFATTWIKKHEVKNV